MNGHLSLQQLTDSGFVEIYRSQTVEQTMDVFISIMEEMKNMLLVDGSIYLMDGASNITVIGSPRLKTFTLTIIEEF